MTPDTSLADTEPVPDFAALYEPGYSRRARMTPRMATRFGTRASTWRTHGVTAATTPEPLVEYLPPLARPLAHGEWYDHFPDCFDHLADRIGGGDGDQERLATCTGEEMALHLAIDLAEALTIDELLDVDAVSSLRRRRQRLQRDAEPAVH